MTRGQTNKQIKRYDNTDYFSAPEYVLVSQKVKNKKVHNLLVSDRELIALHCIIQCPCRFSKPQAWL